MQKKVKVTHLCFTHIPVTNVKEASKWYVNGKSTPRTAYFCNNIFESNETLKKNNIQVEDIIEESGCGWTFEVYDPDGNRITIWKAN
jgi:predicted enzyme related to lactoylglutathione lyase